MMKGSGPARLAVQFRKDIGAEEVKVRLDSSGRVVEIGKDIDPLLAVGESIGIERFSREWRDALFATLSDQIERRSLTNQFYESAFQELMDDGMEMRATDTAGFPCMELDTPEDLRRAEDEVLPLLSWD
jgi:choline kinase